jgi:hypothetical protein
MGAYSALGWESRFTALQEVILAYNCRKQAISLIHSVAVLQSTPALSFRTTICKVFFIHD